MSRYAKVIIDISIAKLDRPYSYRIPAGLEGSIKVGDAVLIPFGKGDTRRRGYVVDISDDAECDESMVKELIGHVPGALSAEDKMIALAGFIKRNFGGTMTQAIDVCMPVKNVKAPKVEYELVLSASLEDAQEFYYGLLSMGRRSKRKEELLIYLLTVPEHRVSFASARQMFGADASVVDGLCAAGVIRKERSRLFRRPAVADEGREVISELNKEQRDVYERVAAFLDTSDSLGACKPGAFLLQGVTGSGKTAVYIKLIEECVAMGKQAIVLIPEFALTYQTLQRFYAVFKDRVAVVNSKMTPAQRYDAFDLAKTGEVDVMIGPRSALFTPFLNLGLIIIDEEHETSYRSQNVPRYDAVPVAVERCRLENAVVLLGSATPRVESMYKARSGEYELLTLTQRARGSMATAEIVDMRDELRHGNRSILSDRLKELIEDRLKKKEQSLLFLNRRGLKSFVSCRSCGTVIKCPHCDVSMALHGDASSGGREYLKCHYCGFSMDKPAGCPSCGSKYIGAFKAGTQSLETEVKKFFPTARVLRMDADTTTGKDSHQDILSAFYRGEADILIGTQMIVKGHDFPRVTLVGAVAADISLAAGGYACAERTFDLLTQAVGRAGRGMAEMGLSPGVAVIQTYKPTDYAIEASASQDYDRFYEQEIAFRGLMNYPPVGHMLTILMSHADMKVLTGFSEELAGELGVIYSKLNILGPVDASVSKVKDLYYRVIHVKSRLYNDLIDLKDCFEKKLLDDRSGVHVFFDFDGE